MNYPGKVAFGTYGHIKASLAKVKVLFASQLLMWFSWPYIFCGQKRRPLTLALACQARSISFKTLAANE